MDKAISTTETAAIVPKVWSSKFYKTMEVKMPFNDSVDRDYDGDIQNLGDTVNISTVPDFEDAEVLPEGASANAEAVTISGQQLIINKRIVKDFIVTKKSQLQSLPFMDKVRDKAVYAIQKTMQALIIADVAPSVAAPDHVLSYASGTTLALADILGSQELMNTQNLPMTDRMGIIGSAQFSDVFNITGYTSKDFIPEGSPLSTGEFKFPLAGFEIKLTTVVGNTSTWFHRSFLTLAIQQQLQIAIYDLGAKGNRSTRVNLDLLFGLKLLDNKRVITIS